MSDWDASDSDTNAAPSAPSKAVPAVKLPVKKTKWEGEDEDDNDVASDWEESEEEEERKPKTAAAAAAPPPPAKKKGSIKQKIAEKEAQKAAQAAVEQEDDLYDEDDVLDPREKARRDRERQLQSDLRNAADLLGAAALGGTDYHSRPFLTLPRRPQLVEFYLIGTSDKELDKLISFDPRTKEDFQAFSKRIVDYIIKRHQNKPLYASFVEHHVRELALPLKDVEVRKAASALTTLANEKQKEQRDKTGGKKKTKAAAKPVLGSTKALGKLDTNAYDEVLDDFGNDPNDFM
ncbi:translation initiation factor eIF3 subunit [Sanghuangporus baumii]|uniref:Eukaryotic translation initiation factor 3 subunit J n=1 Tax=Sanghuangporus baumii TaxID=108892 RepID=A0A9Q5I218_SANBA|nr:translation initiation factor eIF3 subunit [Sanghuangporus baumii]